jgi:hypothetical protein
MMKTIDGMKSIKGKNGAAGSAGSLRGYILSGLRNNKNEKIL